MRTVLRYNNDVYFDFYFRYDLFVKWIDKVKSFNFSFSKLPEHLFKKFRHYFCPARLYKYGKVGLFVNDDRTGLEKVCDRIDDYFESIRDNQRLIKANSQGRYRWHTYFEPALGMRVDDPSILRQHEKEGNIWTTHQESERECAKTRARNKLEAKEKRKAGLREALGEISRNNKSYYNVIKKQAVEDMKIQRERAEAYGR